MTQHERTMMELCRNRSRLYDMKAKEENQRIAAEYEKASQLVNDAIGMLLRAEYIESISR